MNRRTLLLGLLAGALAAACKDPPAAPPDAGVQIAGPPPIRVTAERTDLIFSFPQGAEYRTATAVADVPEAARAQVIVTDLSLSPQERQAERFVYIADLREARSDKTYPVAIASRYGFEAKLDSVPAGDTPPHGDSPREVIIYTTSWCGVCTKTKRLLTKLGVPFTEKDVEGSRKAATEVAKKSAAAGLKPGAVPVIDVAGTLLQGLDERSLRQALRAKGFIQG